MTPAQLLFCLTCLLCGTVAQQAQSLQQKSVFVTVNIGDNLTLECPFDNLYLKFYWFKQSLGEIPRLISEMFHGADKGVFEEEFTKDMRFKMDTDGNQISLSISNIQLSDSATYFCTKGYSTTFEFVKSITVFVKGSDLNKAKVRQSPHEETEPGRSVTLNCSVHTGTCDGPHRVYWFKQSSESAAGVLYSHGGSSDQCGRNTDSQTNSCVYNLPIHNVSSEQTGTYYCAVALCGQVLFGNGTKVDVKGETNIKAPVLVYVLSGALGVTIILVVFLTLSLYKKESCRCRESQARLSPPPAANREGDQDADNLHYAALHINKANPRSNSRNQQSTSRNDCVYSSVK